MYNAEIKVMEKQSKTKYTKTTRVFFRFLIFTAGEKARCSVHSPNVVHKRIHSDVPRGTPLLPGERTALAFLPCHGYSQ